MLRQTLKGEDMKTLITLVAVMISLNLVQANTFRPSGDRLIGSLGGDTLNSRWLTGTLVAGIAAIGGETSGVFIREVGGFNAEVYPLDGEMMQDLLHYASTGEVVTISGGFQTIKGVEIPFRNVFFVTGLSLNDSPITDINLPRLCGMGGPKMVNPSTGHCIQSLNTCETGDLLDLGYVVDSSCE